MQRRLAVGASTVSVFLTAVAWLPWHHDQHPDLPNPYQRPVVCAFPRLDFQLLTIGTTELEVLSRYAERPVRHATTGCIAYRYAPQLFNDSSPPLFITLLFSNGILQAKWIQERTPSRHECPSGMLRVVEVTDLLHDEILGSQRAAQR